MFDATTLRTSITWAALLRDISLNLLKEKTLLYIPGSDGGTDGFPCSVVRVEGGISECQALFMITSTSSGGSAVMEVCCRTWRPVTSYVIIRHHCNIFYLDDGARNQYSGTTTDREP